MSERRSYAFAIVIGAIVLFAAAVVAIVLATSGASTPETAPGEGTVGIEIRARPPAAIRVEGNPVGRTPLTVHVRRSSTSLRIEATIGGHPMAKQVVPDHDQIVDFTAR